MGTYAGYQAFRRRNPSLLGGSGEDPSKFFTEGRGGLQRRFGQALGEAGVTGRQAEQSYLRRAEAFDPSQALNRYATGAYSTISRRMKDQLRDLAGSAVGAGRLDTGFFDEDQGEVVNRNLADFNAQISQQALNAAQLELANQQDIGRFGQATTNRYLDLVSGGLDRANLEEEMRRNKGGGFFSKLGGLAGGVGGFLVGGPAGAAAGAKIGSSVF